ncbi:dephospho-CoA kinase [Phytomonospora sp. NPDC050363]|uniref:dephospho-CoA kinase n=1 Tax=Phytomonospora sp. NPDC050363 TaxID=3155642 RepID=UPI0033EE4508
MLRIGLTGGIGSGKSAVATHLASLGAIVIDSDVLAREVVAPGTEGLAAIRDAFGAEVLTPGGELDRAALAGRVFGDDAARRVLEGIIHPRVRHRAAELFDAAPADALVVNDVPLLAEVGLAPTFHLVIVVETPVETRIERLAERGMSEAEARGRIAAQLDDTARRRVADVVLDNSGGLDSLHAAVDVLWRDRLVPYERNVREGVRAQRPEELRMGDYDPAWPARFERIAGRIRHALGDVALAVEHTGSTSVPGLAAKDVIDIQIAVADLTAVDALRPAMAAAGFVVVPHITGDTPKPFAPDPVDWAKRLFGGTDPADITHVHVRVEGSPGWRYALMFRDWLRADDEARAGYQAIKKGLAATGATATEYAEAKEPWFTEIWPRLEDWARRTNWEPARAPR